MNNRIKEQAEYYISEYGTRNPFEIAKRLKIEVQIGNPGCDGCYMFLKKHRYIFLNQSLSENERTLVMAHELGHAILHQKQNCYFIRNKTLFLNSKFEIEANTFAAELLIPDNVIYENPGMDKKQLSCLIGCCESLFNFKNFIQKRHQEVE